MRTHIKYFQLRYTMPEEHGKEVKPCGVCGARLYLEGKSAVLERSAAPDHRPSDATSAASSSSSMAQSSSSVILPLAKKAKTAAETVKELSDLKHLKDQGLVDSPNFKNLKDRILRGE